MKRRIAMLAALPAVVAASVLMVVQPAAAAVGLHVSGRAVVEANGSPFVMRGVNHPHVWYTNRTSSFADIKAAGANTVRVVLGTGKRWGPSTDVPQVVSLCKQNRLICVLEVHDTTGYPEEAAGAATLDEAVDYWISQKSALVGQENYVVINIGNEPIGNVEPGQWTAATADAIARMRSNGFEHLLMADAPNWGQDWTNTMRANARTVWEADPQRNTVFSIHMYSVYNTAASITSYFDAFESLGLPLVVGEFGWQFRAGEVDHETILAETQRRGLGWLAWSWSGNTDPIIDMTVDFDPGRLTTFGQRIVNGPDGLKATAKEATIYGSGSPSSAPPSSAPPSSAPPSSSPPPAGGRSCTAAYRVAGQWQGGFQGEVRVTAGSIPITGWTVTWTFADGQSVSQAWNATATTAGGTVTARNAGYNGSLGAGGGTTFGFIGSWTGRNSVPAAVSCVAS